MYVRARPCHLLIIWLVVWCAVAGQAVAVPTATDDEQRLAQRYAPVLKVAVQTRDCGPGEPYRPTDIDAIMDNPEVALRGPWQGAGTVTVAPAAGDLNARQHGYNLDFPGDALSPGCTYEQWSRRLQSVSSPTTYARAFVGDDDPDTLVLQYWFFWPFNDWENNHEGDWEMIQLHFPATSAAEALTVAPREVGYSQHASGERAAWQDEKLERIDDTHPVVYPATGSHANYFSSDLFVGRGGREGMGCDDATGADFDIRPAVQVFPGDADRAVAAYPWLAFRGYWGERQQSFFNGPTGPADKTQWRRPSQWAASRWRDSSLTIPAGSLVGTGATDAFCGAVGGGSRAVRYTMANPTLGALAVAALVALTVIGVSRTRWTPSSPLRVGRRRGLGQIVTASIRMIAAHPTVFLAIGATAVPIALLAIGAQWLLTMLVELLPGDVGNGVLRSAGLGAGVAVTAVGFVLVSAMVARAILDIDAKRPVSAAAAARAVGPQVPGLLWRLALILPLQMVLDATIVLIPVALYLLARFSLYPVVQVAEPGVPPVRRAWVLTRDNVWRSVVVVVGAAGVAALAGPLVGVVFIIATGLSFTTVNLIAAVVYVVMMPVATAMMTYLYADLRVRHELRDVPQDGELPTELPVPLERTRQTEPSTPASA